MKVGTRTSQRFQNGSLIRVKNKTTEDTWFLRYYEEVQGKRVYRKQRIGTVVEYPHRRHAEKAALSLRSKINSEVRSPETVNNLIAHYSKHELTTERKSFSTVEVNGSFIKLYVAPKWGTMKLSEVRTVAVEKWLSALPKSPATRTKIKAVFSALFSHAIRHEWVQHNPIKAVRCSAKRLREKDVLTPSEFAALLGQLIVRDKAIVMLAGSTGLRRSEFIGLRWSDIDHNRKEIAVTKSCVRNRFGNTKTEASGKPVPLHPAVWDALTAWRKESRYQSEADFLFPSDRLKGEKPLSPDMILRKVIRPALKEAKIEGKVIGWHSFRHSLATNLRSLGVDVKVAQELLRHANSRTTMDIYTHAVSAQKHEATGKIVDLFLPQTTEGATIQHPSAPLQIAELAVSD
jgi:integrase